MKSTILSGQGDGQGSERGAGRSAYELARYEQIAFDIATKIVRKEYIEGEKLYGRSTLAGQYNVSPETIRRAVALLQSMNVVLVEAGRGIIVGSREAAELFVKEFETRHIMDDMRSRISELVEERNKINREIDEILGKLISYTVKMTGWLQKIEEVEVPPGSYLIGKSLASVGFRARTGATVLALERNGEEIFSPDVSMTIQEGDLLVYVGPSDCVSKVEELLKAEQPG
ncbi:MAG: GntR family transcriptional regulator [Firmicutes bacterium]|nr:GntR family transcriptional regulator [Bacillota bacterium]